MTVREIHKIVVRPYKVLVEVRGGKHRTTVTITTKRSELTEPIRKKLTEKGLQTTHVYIDGYGYIRIVYTNVNPALVDAVRLSVEEVLRGRRRKVENLTLIAG